MAEIGERLTGCPSVTAGRLRLENGAGLSPAHIIALRALKSLKTEAGYAKESKIASGVDMVDIKSKRGAAGAVLRQKMRSLIRVER